MPQWIVIAVEAHVPWPTSEETIKFRGVDILVRPETETLAQTIAIPYEPPTNSEQAIHMGRQFLSALAWAKQGAITEITVAGSGSHPIKIGKSPNRGIFASGLRADYLPDPTDPKVRLALSLYREAQSINSKPYQLLGFFKIINILYASGKDQISWINQTLPNLTSFAAKERVKEIQSSGKNVGEDLYGTGRCAVAHAFNAPIVDPENPNDLRRIHKDLPLIRALAEYAIEFELGVKSQQTIWKEHLYELDGFRKIFGADLVSSIKEKKDVPQEQLTSIMPSIDLRLRDRKRFSIFENMQFSAISSYDGQILARYESSDKLLAIGVALNFSKERLEFNAINDVAISDDGTKNYLEHSLEHLDFVREMFLNGELEIWNHSTSELLGRCDAYLPMNIDLNETLKNFDHLKRQLEEELQTRSRSTGNFL